MNRIHIRARVYRDVADLLEYLAQFTRSHIVARYRDIWRAIRDIETTPS